MKNFLTRIFGQFQWQKPDWVMRARERSGNYTRRSIAWIESHPAQVGLIVLALVALGSVGHYYARLPKPMKVEVTVYAPSLTPNDKKREPFPAKIRFSESVAPLSQIGKVATEIDLRPPHPGKWIWTDQKELTFVPEKDWPIGERFDVKIARKAIAGHLQLATNEVSFEIQPFRVANLNLVFHQDPTAPMIKKGVATASFNYPVDPASLEKNFVVELNGKAVESSVLFHEDHIEAYIHSANIRITDAAQNLVVTLQPGIRSRLGGKALGDKKVATLRIPSLYDYFRVIGMQAAIARNPKNEPEHVLIVRATDAMRPEDIEPALSVWLLPLHHPKVVDPKGPFDWAANMAQVTPDILQKSQRIALRGIPVEHEAENLLSFSFQADVQRYLFVRLAKGVKSYGGFELLKEVYDVVRVPEFPRELKILGEGAILGLSGEKSLSIFARNVRKVKVKIQRLLADDIHHFVSQTNGSLQSPYFDTEWKFNFENLTEAYEDELTLPMAKPGEPVFVRYDLSKYLQDGRKGFFQVTLIGDPPEPQAGKPEPEIVAAPSPTEYSEDEGMEEGDESEQVAEAIKGPVEEKRFLLLTDLGFVYKENLDKSRTVFVQSFATGEGLGNTKVTVLGLNGAPLLSQVTNAQGRAEFPKLDEFKREKTPTVYVIEHGADLSFMPYQKGVREQDLSRFPVEGIANAVKQGELRAYLFSDRGLYRPGDEIRIGLMVKAADWKKNLEGLPLKVQVFDPKGVEIKKAEIKLSTLAFEEFRFSTLESSPTGEYRIQLNLPKSNKEIVFLGSTAVRVEEFLPDRLKIHAFFSEERPRGWIQPEGLTATVSLQNLFGTAAVDHEIRGAIRLNPAFPSFAGYSDFHFYDPLYDPKAERVYEEALPTARTNDRGEAEIQLNLQRFARATYWLTFKAEGFEKEGGRSVFFSKSAIVSPLPYFLGTKAEQSLSYIQLNSPAAVSLLALNPRLDKTAVPGITATLFEKRFVSVLSQQANGTFAYVSVEKEQKLQAATINLAANGQQFALKTDKPGDFFYKFTNAEGLTLQKIAYSVAGDANLTRSLERTAELQVKLSRDDYNPGDEIELEIRAPYAGSGLITVERDRVYNHVWFRANQSTSIQRIRIPEELEGNGYVSVSFLRDVNSKEIYMSPHTFGVVPFSLNRKSRTEVITLSSAEQIRPGKPYAIRYKTERPGKILVFAVDEGILQVAGYRNPDPLAYYLAKRKLDVRTYQILDLILPEYRLLAEGRAPGGGSEVAEPTTNLNPFKRKRKPPVAYWSGLLEADATERQVTFDIPDYYNGTLRLIAIAVSRETLGIAAKPVLVQAPLIISPNVPTFVAPGDRFRVTASVANNLAGSGKNVAATIGLGLSQNLKLLSANKVSLSIDEQRDGTAAFEIEALEGLGNGDLVFTAEAKGESVRTEESLSLRPAVPYMVTFAAGMIKRGENKEVKVERTIFPEFRDLTAEHALAPTGLIRALFKYLSKFPHGCTEQVVSQAFPHLVLADLPEYGVTRSKAEIFVGKTIDLLRTRLTFDGAYGTWAAYTGVDDMSSLYAIHFLLDAKDKNYAVPESLLEKNREYLRRLTSVRAPDYMQQRLQAYALYLLTRMGERTTTQLTNLSDQLDKDKRRNWRGQSEGIFIASSYQVLQAFGLAQKILSGFRLEDQVEVDYDYFYNQIYRDALYFYLLAKHFPERFQNLGESAYRTFVLQFQYGQCNTFDAAHTILALDAVLRRAQTADFSKLTIEAKEAKDFAQLPVTRHGLGNEATYLPSHRLLRFRNESAVPLSFYAMLTGGFDRALPKEEIRQNLEITRMLLRNRAELKGPVRQGEEVEVELRIRSLGNRWGYHHVAIVDLLPGGFDPVIDTVRGHFHQAADARTGEEEVQAKAIPDFRSTYADAREDRVLFYGTATPTAAAIRYRIKAVNAGTYALPPLYAESMYDRGVRARTLGGTIVVEK